ncbi:MAG: XRE family transcriptional regulator [Nocardia sp.]|nr:XRE family transcriptional regulator [Nocardia sp.]
METFESIWDAIEPPEHAEHMKARADVMFAVVERISALELSPAEAADRLGVKRSRIYELQAGKVNLFSLDKLVDFAARLGIHIQVITTGAA